MASADLTVNLKVGVEFDMPDLRRPTFWEWLTRKKVVAFTSRWKVDRVVPPQCEAWSTPNGAISKSFRCTRPQGHNGLHDSDGIRWGIGCSHAKRVPYEPEFSVGDESDMQSKCMFCGRVLRDAPNFEVF